jgi:hypothetical protein
MAVEHQLDLQYPYHLVGRRAARLPLLWVELVDRFRMGMAMRHRLWLAFAAVLATNNNVSFATLVGRNKLLYHDESTIACL